ncbi:MAG: DUF362 domain-containing protein [Bacteroidales bacterium]|nr:DUF362 domain-containing protein [Bacteroidales bacterium]
MRNSKENGVDRRKFFKVAALGGLGISFAPSFMGKSIAQEVKDGKEPAKPKTNVEDALKHPRTATSMPGKYPAKVVRVNHQNAVVDNKPGKKAAAEMLEKAMLSLTGAATLKEAWLQFVKPGEKIGLKVNPVAGKSLTTSHAVTQSIIAQLEDAGIPRKDIVIWDRREFQLHETGYTKENYPGIKITGTERKDEEGSYYNKEGDLYSLEMIDKDWYYWADVDGEYDEYTLPYMVNEGKYSYFSKICTQEVDKIINVPILKNAGASITLCMKNLGYGAITNTSRLHKQLWGDTSAEVCAFPPLRDKVVLNIVDGLKGCFNGGPGANPQYIINYNTLLAGTDPVAVDRVGYDIVIKKRIEKGVQEKDSPRGRKFMEMAANLKLGEHRLEKIDLKEINLG